MLITFQMRRRHELRGDKSPDSGFQGRTSSCRDAVKQGVLCSAEGSIEHQSLTASLLRGASGSRPSSATFCGCQSDRSHNCSFVVARPTKNMSCLYWGWLHGQNRIIAWGRTLCNVKNVTHWWINSSLRRVRCQLLPCSDNDTRTGAPGDLEIVDVINASQMMQGKGLETDSSEVATTDNWHDSGLRIAR
jgi:hypothetical protein